MRTDELTAEINGQRLHYLRAGIGRPLLLLHGVLGGSFCWRLNMEAFSRQHTVLAVDLPGFGESDSSGPLDCSMAGQASRLSCMLEQFGLDSVDVVGSSWGAAIAMLLAARSGKVRSLVLAAPVNPWSNLGAGRIRFLRSRLGGALLRMVWPISHPLHRTALERMYGDLRRAPAGTIEGYSSLAMRPGRVNNILTALRSWETDLSELRKAIPHIKARSLLIWGTRDRAVDLRSAEVLRQALPQGELALVQGAGHLPFEEMPEEFNRLVLDFVDKP